MLGYRSERRLQNLRSAGTGPVAIKLPTGGVRYRIEDLETWAVAVTIAGEPDLRSSVQAKRQTAKQAERRQRDLERQRKRRAAERRDERK